MQILYVEDNLSEAQYGEAMLRSEGHFCHTANDGRQAIALARRNEYDLIIVDIMLPDIDGYQVIEQIQEAGVTAPFLIQSGLVDKNWTLDGLGSGGVAGYLAKPFTRDELKKRIERATSGSVETPFRQDQGPPKQSDPCPAGAERRQHRRFATLKSAEIIDGEDRHACIVLNLSHSGAGLRLPQQKIPKRSVFKLQLQSGPVHECRICWKAGDKVGVKFLTTGSCAEKPKAE
ncbi:MAG: response regulator [Kiloniellales bacterium]|nr:response regulator [Kiloniellales bacterium]